MADPDAPARRSDGTLKDVSAQKQVDNSTEHRKIWPKKEACKLGTSICDRISVATSKYAIYDKNYIF
jgi:hypothetical protein